MKYITITPSNQRNKVYVAREAIGGNYYIIATCTSEDYAKRIAAAMNQEPVPVEVIKPLKKRAR
jgi:hypothetical protein